MRRLLVLLSLVTTPLFAGTYTVTNTSDDGPGSLRQAIVEANSAACAAPCDIVFRIAGPVPESGWFTIRPASPLPPLSAIHAVIHGETQESATGDTNFFGPEVEIDGSLAGLAPGIKLVDCVDCGVAGLAINRFEGNGIVVDRGTGNVIGVANYIGVDPTGMVAMPNGFNGIALINTTRPWIRSNLISGNRQNGIFAIVDGGTFEGNRIGTGRATGIALGNGAHGIDLGGRGAYLNSNFIAHNALEGVAIRDDARAMHLSNDRVFDNGSKPIVSPSGVQAPVITSARATAIPFGNAAVEGTVHAAPNTLASVNVFAAPRRAKSGGADASVWLGATNIRTDANGDAAFRVALVIAPGGFVTATATIDELGTSELSAPFPLVTNAIEVTTGAPSGPGSLADAIAQANESRCTIEESCWIAFHIPEEQLIDGVARIVVEDRLPTVTADYVVIDGSAQTYWTGDRNALGPEVEIRGAESAQGSGLVIDARLRNAGVRDLAIGGFPGDGITVRVPPSLGNVFLTGIYCGVDATGAEALPNGGAGIRLDGTVSRLGATPSFATVSGVISGNGGDGITAYGASVRVAAAIGLDATQRRAIPNGASGVYFGSGSNHSVSGVVAFNGAKGVSTAPGVRAVAVTAQLFGNDALAIDRDNDGPGEGDALPNAPQILSATFDEARRKTHVIFRPASKQNGPVGPTGREVRYTFFANRQPRSEAEDFAQSDSDGYAPVVPRPDGTLEIFLSRDWRGFWITATTGIAPCFWEAGCLIQETSEISAPVKVE